MQTIKNAASRTTTNEKGNKLYYFRYAPDKPWIFDEKNLQAFTNEGYQLLLDKEECEEEELNELFSENVIWFQGVMEFDDFAEESRQIGENMFEHDGKTWYIDWHEMTAYTDKGLTLMFKTGEIGHVRQALIKDGYNSYQEQIQALKQAAKSVDKEDMKKAFKKMEEERRCVLH